MLVGPTKGIRETGSAQTKEELLKDLKHFMSQLVRFPNPLATGTFMAKPLFLYLYILLGNICASDHSVKSILNANMVNIPMVVTSNATFCHIVTEQFMSI